MTTNDGRPHIAIIDPNTLASIGLKQLLQNVIPAGATAHQELAFAIAYAERLLGGAGAGSAALIPLARSWRGYRCCIVPSQPPFDPAETALRLHEDLERQGWRRFSLAGFSLGACTALRYASLFPEQVESLLLCAAFPGLTGETRERFLRLRALRADGDKEAFLALWKDVLFGGETLPREPFPLPDSDTFCSQMDAALAFDGAGLARPSCPVRVTLGIRDRLVSPDLTRALAEHLSVFCEEYPGGHLHFLKLGCP